MNNFNSTLRYIDALPRKQRRRNNMQLANTSFSGGGSLPLSSLVTIADAQIITGIKDYINGFKIGGLPIYKSQDDTIYIDANIVVRGGITARGTNTTQSPSIFEALPIDGDTIKRTSDGRLYVDADALNISGGGGVADSVSWENVTGKPSWIGSTKPTYTPQDIGALPITGGKTITGDFSIDVGKRILVDGNNLVGTRVFGDDKQNPRVILSNINKGTVLISNDDIKSYRSGKEYTILDSGNYSNYTLPITGGTVDGSLYIGGSLYPTNIKYYGSGKVIWHNDENHYFIDCPNGVLTYQAYSGHSFLGGNVAIGSTTASEKLHVHGNLLATGGITARYTSDMRLKQNRRSFKASEVLMSLGAVQQFEYIPSEVEKNKIYEGTHIGLIYQNVVGTALNRMCHEREDGYGSLNYLEPSFISLLAGVGQEHEVRIQQLERENKTLKEEVEKLKKRAA